MMKLAMLGDSYGYGLSPGGYHRANGRGYVGGITIPGSLSGTMLGASAPATDEEVQEVYKLMGPTTDWDAALKIWQAQKGTTRVIQITSTANTILDSLAKGYITVKQAMDQAEKSGDASTLNQVKAVAWKQYIPWGIAGAALLVGVLIITGTRRRR